jgi:hypothetical protein
VPAEVEYFFPLISPTKKVYLRNSTKGKEMINKAAVKTSP